MNKMNMDSIADVELCNIISEESSKFRKNASKKIFAKKIANISLAVLNKVDNKLNGAGISATLESYFMDTFSKNLNPGLAKSLEHGGIGTNVAEEIGCVIQKYVAQESIYRTDLLNKKYRIKDKNVSRKAVIEDIVKTFESDELQLELSESLNQEYDDLVKSSEEAIIDESAKEVIAAVADAEKKAEVTKVIIDEFKQMSEKAKVEQDALNPEKETSTEPVEESKDQTGTDSTSTEPPAATQSAEPGASAEPETLKPAEESFNFNSTNFIKEKIPVTVKRFTFENEREPFTKEKFKKILMTLEENSAIPADDRDYIRKRIDAIRSDAVVQRDFDVSKVDDVEKAFNEAVKDINTSFSALRMLGFSNSDNAAFKTDKDTLDVIKKMADMKNPEGDKNVNDVEILVVKKVTPTITSAEEFIQIAFESFVLKTEEPGDGVNYEDYRKAIEVRDDLISEFIVDGLKHVPAARAERLKEINNGLRKLATVGIDNIEPKRIKRIYYKTAKVADPGIFTDFRAEADRVKAMIADTYKTNQYDVIVDDFFVNKTVQTPVKISTESSNLFEIGAFKAAKEMTAKSIDISTESNSIKVRGYGKAFASYMKTLETLNIITKKDIIEYSRSI